jgi:hypothetical protein
MLTTPEETKLLLGSRSKLVHKDFTGEIKCLQSM